MRRRSSISWLSAFCVRLLSVMSCAILETPTISPAAERIGEMLSETSTLAAILVHARGFVMLDPLAAADPLEDVAHFGAPVRRNDDVDVLADRFRRRE